jgi:outer membrane protein
MIAPMTYAFDKLAAPAPVLAPLFALLLAAPLHAQQSGNPAPDASWRLTGDIGLGVNAAPTPARAQSRQTGAIPYLNFDAGPLFARIDTFGVKLLPAGAGDIELLIRVLSDGYTPDSAGLKLGGQRRRDSVPLGLGTLQVTTAGAFMFNVYRDAGKPKGTLADLMYAAEIDTGDLALYPQAGLEYRSSAYVRYFDGTPSYRPGAAGSPFAALFAEFHIGGSWYLDGNVRKSWLGKAVRNSPLVRRGTLDAGLLALGYRFK